MNLPSLLQVATAIASLHGTVRGIDHGPPIANALVTVDDVPRSRSNDLGEYRVATLGPGTHRVRFAAIGFAPRLLTVFAGDTAQITLDVELAPMPVALPPIEVIAPVRPDLPAIAAHPDDADPPDSFAFGTDWRLRHVATPADLNGLAAIVPGVTTRSDNALGLSIHGGRASENLVLLDGVPIPGSVHFAGASSALVPEAIGAVTVSTGVAPPRFGGALAGVVELRSRDAPDRFGMTGAVTPTDARGTLGVRLGLRSDLLLAGRGTFRRVLAEEQGALGNDNGYGDLLAIGRMPFAGGTLESVGFGNANRLAWPGAIAEQDQDPAASTGNRARWRSATLGLAWHAAKEERGWQFAAWWNGTDADLALGNADRLSSHLALFGIRAAYNRPVRVGNLTIGTEVTHAATGYRVEQDVEPVLDLRASPWLPAIHAAWTRSAASGLSWSLGARLEWPGGGRGVVDPRLQVRWPIDRNTAIALGLGRTHQAIQSLLNEDNVGTTILGPMLPIAVGGTVPVASATQWTASLERRIGPIEVVLEGYRRDWRDQLTPSVTTGGLFGIAPVVGTGHAEALLATARSTRGRLQWQLTAGTGRAEQQVGPDRFPTGAARPWSLDGAIGYRPGSATAFELAWTTGSGADRSAIAPGVEWLPFQPATGAGEVDGIPENLPGAVNAIRLATPLRIDLGAIHQFTIGGAGLHPLRLHAAVRVHNLLDRTNPVGVMALPDGSFQWLRGTPRNLIAEVGWQF